MLNQRYCSEIESLLIQFVSAFDDGKIVRPIKDSTEVEYIIPRWIVSGKPRVFYDIVNQAGNITLPVSVVEVGGISLAKNRLFNKIFPQKVPYNGTLGYRYKQPTPIDIKVNVTFFTKFFNDIWQMMSNFAVYTQPYIFTSWRAKSEGLPFTEELRCKVTWDGSFNIEYPKTAKEDQQWLIQGTAGFTLEGWLFERPASGGKLITSVHAHLGATAYNVSSVDDDGLIDYYVKEGWPSITAIRGEGLRLVYKAGDVIPLLNGKTFTIEGRSFFKEQCTGLLIKPLSEEFETLSDLTPVTVDTIKMGKVSGFAITEERLDIGENIIKFEVPNLPAGLNYDIIVYNNAGYTSAESSKGITFEAVQSK
jgi:hypothetical protein